MEIDDGTIVTPRLVLERFREEHLTPEYVAWLNDSTTMRFSEQRRRQHTIESCGAYLRSFQGTPNRFLAIHACGPKPEPIGTATVYVDEDGRRGDIGILIGSPRHRGKGMGLEAWIALIDLALHRIGLRKVTAGALAVNVGMVEVMRRSGMVIDGCRHRHVLWEGQEVDVLHFAAFAGQWSPLADAKGRP
ncbi:GNAT family N-acetyltransferase [Azospirillum sp. Marseille-Q6669]